LKKNSDELNIYTKEKEKQFKGLKEKQEQEYIKATDRCLRNQPYSELNYFIQ
jgi:hypothetical protein